MSKVSRLGKIPLKIPQGVNVTLEERFVKVKGPKGDLEMPLSERFSVKKEGDSLLVSPAVADKKSKAFHGLYHRLIRNMLIGVSKGFKKELEIVGVGFRAQTEKDTLKLQVGFSNAVAFPIPKGIKISTPKPTTIVVEGANKQLVGEVAAEIRRIRSPEPYKGKGIRYAGEVVKHKVGKTGAK
jgi:large subunit ribosomal protein L6